MVYERSKTQNGNMLSKSSTYVANTTKGRQENTQEVQIH